jgi:hypothetical protein
MEPVGERGSTAGLELAAGAAAGGGDLVVGLETDAFGGSGSAEGAAYDEPTRTVIHPSKRIRLFIS